MVTVIHYPDGTNSIYFDSTPRKEQKVLSDLKINGFQPIRCDSKEWYGQDNKNYAVHHFNATKSRRSG